MTYPQSNDDPVTAAIWEKLAVVLDPCSMHNGTRLSFVDLGMVSTIEVEPDGHARIRMLLDDPVCFYMVDIISSVRNAALSVSGIKSVDVEIIGDQLWSPDRLTTETKLKMDRWRVARENRLEIKAGQGREV
jgi:metal-sulfur cluster biosynthetic enzyme